MNCEKLMSDKEFERIVVFMKNEYGIDMQEKKVIVNGRLENHLITKGIESYGQLMDMVTRDMGGEEARTLVDLLTTNHTYFMREFEHFEFLKNEVLPELRKSENRTHDLRIWCGASSTGEEPYTIAMVLKDFFGIECPSWDTRVLATDISTRALSKASQGIYLKERIETLPDGWKRRYFKDISAEEVQVTPELKSEVIFRKFNLMDALPFKKKMHTMFMRNVMIYFDNQTKSELLARLYDFMEPGGYLFIGMTETLDKSSTKFQYVRPAVYRKPLL